MTIQTFHTKNGAFYKVYFENSREVTLIEGTAWQLSRWAHELAERTDEALNRAKSSGDAAQ